MNDQAGAKDDVIVVKHDSSLAADRMEINREKLAVLGALEANNDDHLLRKILSVFHTSAPRTLAQINQAVVARDVETMHMQ